jgi:hypothetical protein
MAASICSGGSFQAWMPRLKVPQWTGTRATPAAHPRVRRRWGESRAELPLSEKPIYVGLRKDSTGAAPLR